GLITVGIKEGNVFYASSTAAGGQGRPAAPRLSPGGALNRALGNVDVDIEAGDISRLPDGGGWARFEVAGLSHPQRARLVALPQPVGGVRPAYETLILHNHDGVSVGYTSFVDAVSGQVLVRENIEQQALDNPRWKFFNATPPLDFSDRDTRVVGCWERIVAGDPVAGCRVEIKNDAAHAPWDVDPDTNQPTFTTRGNSANTALSSLSPFTPSDNYRPVSPERDYVYPWTNYWFNEKCPRQNYSPDFETNDLNAAIVNLFAMHNRIHDWSYRLGFTEPNFNLQQHNFAQGGRPGDPETGNAAAGFVTGGAPTYTGRDNANQITPPDGVSPITNMYLWQPIAGAFYPPCVDGDFDMSVVVHEYTHAISNRMVGGPDSGLSDRQGGSMGESWSDLNAVEYLLEHNYVPVGNENPFSVGPYVTGNLKRGIRNYGMNHSPLNYSNVGYDITGAQVHADGEIWSATNFDIRKALIKKYNSRFPASNEALQLRCAEGLAATQCPGNRRWVQIMFDAWLLMPSEVQMVGARDAYLAADKARFDGDNQKPLWDVFARRGFGVGARPGRRLDESFESAIPDDVVIPSFDSPESSNEARIRFRAVGGGKPIKAKFFVGRYEGRVTPIADTIGKTKRRKDRARLVPGRYPFIAQAKGYGMVRFTRKLRPNERRTFVVHMQKNWASSKNKAKARGQETPTGPVTALIDDTESTNWTASQSPNVRGLRATVNLGGGAHRISRLNVSALLRPRNVIQGQGDPQDVSQNRFTALRSFKVLFCKATKANKRCRARGSYRPLFKSPANAFPSVAPRPVAPDLIMRTFKVKKVRATHLRFVVLHNQCTGTKAYQGEQDTDATNVTDCTDGSAQDQTVRVAELQVFSRRSRVRG
ncbi:MAG: M36 family metallopeptidase, partial [Actinomycetota bacterium]|nr:M36 family metallopeptidase [Actinomycetota bacterium]